MVKRQSTTIGHVSRRGFVFLLTLAFFWNGAGVAAQDATPTSRETGEKLGAIEPHPDECLTEPRSLPLFPDPVVGSTPATARPTITGTPALASPEMRANAATTAAVTATVREVLACRNAGDYRRAYALMTDRMLTQLFGGPETIDPEVAAALEARPDRLPRNQRLTLISVSDVRLLADGRVSAEVESRLVTSTRDGFLDEIVFVRVGDRWLIDGTTPLAFSEG